MFLYHCGGLDTLPASGLYSGRLLLIDDGRLARDGSVAFFALHTCLYSTSTCIRLQVMLLRCMTVRGRPPKKGMELTPPSRTLLLSVRLIKRRNTSASLQHLWAHAHNCAGRGAAASESDDLIPLQSHQPTPVEIVGSKTGSGNVPLISIIFLFSHLSRCSIPNGYQG
jgi:hypothetical protein